MPVSQVYTCIGNLNESQLNMIRPIVLPQMIIAEILAYNADIICLQEVDASIHDTLLSPVLTACGFQGFYSNKVRLGISC